MKDKLPAYVERVVEELETSEPGLRLVEWRPYRRDPFRYALRFETDVARSDEELLEIEERMWAILNERLGVRRLLVYTTVAPAPAPAAASA